MFDRSTSQAKKSQFVNSKKAALLIPNAVMKLTFGRRMKTGKAEEKKLQKRTKQAVDGREGKVENPGRSYWKKARAIIAIPFLIPRNINETHLIV